MNPLIGMLSQMGGGQMGGGNIMMQAVGSMMRGENPQTFMKNLANTNPQLKGMDMSNLQNTAQDLCNKNGVDMSQAVDQIKNQMGKMN